LRDSADAIISLEAMSKRTNATTMATEASKETASNLMEAEAAMQGYAGRQMLARSIASQTRRGARASARK
jgi:hypothetical protein